MHVRSSPYPDSCRSSLIFAIVDHLSCSKFLGCYPTPRPLDSDLSSVSTTLATGLLSLSQPLIQLDRDNDVPYLGDHRLSGLARLSLP